MSTTDENGQGAVAEADLATLTGDIRDMVLTHIRSMGDPWAKMGEAAQGEKIDAVERMAEDVVRRCTQLIARNGFDHVPIIISDFVVKGGEIKGKFEAMRTEAGMVALGDHQGRAALIILADHTAYFGERAPAEVDPDQPLMPLDGDGAGDADQPSA